MIFQNLMGLKNLGVTVPSGTTQGNSYPFMNLLKCSVTNFVNNFKKFLVFL